MPWNVETNVWNKNLATPTTFIDPTPIGVTETQYAQERFLNVSTAKANPNFRLTGSFNKLTDVGEGPIRRGYIRRSDIDPADPTSEYRLYFMYNPEIIRRSYIAYLDQQSLDPFNALYGSNNMVAPPGILDFSFELFFDRHIEVATDPNHPGVKVDYDYFDIVVRGVVPDSNENGNAIPDNGIMMVNPKNVTVVFGADLSVQGRPYNASVSFDKFNNSMTPTRMRLSIALKAFYIGPVQTVPNYAQFTSENVYKATIPYDETVKYTVSYETASTNRLTLNSESSEFTSLFNTGSSNSSGQYTGPAGEPPADIPRGPFELRVMRTSNTQTATPDPSIPVIQLSGQQVIQLLVAQNCPIEGAVFLWALAKRESGFIANVAGINNDNSTDVGLWQINSTNWNGASGQQMADPWTNVSTAMRLSNGGTSFLPWQTHGVYNVYDGSHTEGVDMEEAYTFFLENGYPV